MDLSNIIFNSLKYPFRNIAKLPIISILFILIAITPIGYLLDNKIIIFIGVVAFFIFILIVPGFFLDVIKTGSRESSMFPSFNLVNSVYDSIRVLALRMVYMIVPAFFAKARLAYLDSLSEALKINRVIGDIRNIGIFNIIKWLIAMAILMVVISFVSSFVLTIPYVGFLIDVCIIIPIMESIANYSLGLLYSNIT